MKLSYITTIGNIGIITGCVMTTTPRELRNDVMPIEYTSILSARNLAFCISDGWEQKITRAMEIQKQETFNGYSVWIEVSVGSPLVSAFSVKNNTIVLADIDNSESGSIARYYIDITDDKKYWVSALEKCINDAPVKSIITPKNSTLEPQTDSSISQKLHELQEMKIHGYIFALSIFLGALNHFGY